MTPEPLKQIDTELWQSADDPRAKSNRSNSECGTAVLGSLFLKFTNGKVKQRRNAGRITR